MTTVGKTLGQYDIIEEVGAGGMATVYKAYQPSLKRFVAVKVLATQLARDETFRQRFKKEAEAVARLSHPHILPVYDFAEQEDLVYIVTEFVEGGSLRDRLAGPLDFGVAARIAHEIALALDAAHRQAIYHRDVKPGNILISADGRSRLADFGLVKMLADTHFTATGMTMGTPAYMSPEQAKGEQLDGRSDLYSLGIVLYEMVTGRTPFRADTPLAVLHQHAFSPPPPPRSLNPAVPRRLERVILKALAKEPEDRYRTGRQMAAALEKAVKLAPVEEMPAPSPDQAATVAVSPVPLRTSRRWLSATGPALQRTGKGLWFLVSRLGRFGLRLAAVLLVAVLVLGVIGAAIASFALSAFAERTIPTYDEQLAGFELSDERFTVSELELDSSVATSIEPYALDTVKGLSVDLSPPDTVILSAEAWDQPLRIQARLALQQGNLQVYVERLNRVPLYVVGGIISGGINRGIAELFDRAAFELEKIEVTDSEIVLWAAAQRGATVSPGPTATLRPSPTAPPTSEPVGQLIVVNEVGEEGILELDDQTWTLAAGQELELELAVDSYPYVFTVDKPGYQPVRGTLRVEPGTVLSYILQPPQSAEANQPAAAEVSANPTGAPVAAATKSPTRRPTTNQSPSPTPTRAPYCPDQGAKITSPGQSVPVRGLVSINGTASIPDFDYYKVEMRRSYGDDWVTLGQQVWAPVSQGTLFVWDSGQHPVGRYTLRLMVVDVTGNYKSCEVSVRVVR